MNGAKTIAEKFADYLGKVRFEDIPSEVIHKATLCILDALGVALAGSITPIGIIARKFGLAIGGRKETTVYHYGDRIACIPATYVNATMASCHNLTDTNLSCVVHCGPVVIPAALSVAEKEGRTGKEFITAVIAGYEVMTRVGNVINSGTARMSHHKRGFHATGTTGVFGASMAASKLLDLNQEQIVDSLGIAGSYASGIFESVTSPETETWRTHPGIAAQNGVSAAILSQLGLKGPPSVLEGKNGFFSVFGDKNFDLGKAEEGFGKSFLIMDSAFKLHNCAHVWHIPLDCLSHLIKVHKFRPEDVAEIKVTIPTMYSYVMDSSQGSKYPRSCAEALNHLPYGIAAMMLHGAVFIEQFSDSVLKDPRMKEMVSKVTVEIDPSLDEIFKETDKTPAQVRIKLKGGKELSEAMDYPRGSPRDPANREEIEMKFINLATTVLPKEKAWELARLVEKIETLHNLRDLIDHLVV